MKLTNFGTALKFAMHREDQTIEIYEGTTRNLKNIEVRDILLSLAMAGKKRRAALERLYRENMYSDMDTGIFEPIAGLNVSEYIIEVKRSYKVKYPDILKLAIEIEDKTEKFYHELANRLKVRRSGIARDLLKMNQENLDDRLKLKHLEESMILAQ
ncbi:MAG: hypothetical protein AB1502_08120 [Thermodesulfobacteriota bacterium]